MFFSFQFDFILFETLIVRDQQ